MPCLARWLLAFVARQRSIAFGHAHHQSIEFMRSLGPGFAVLYRWRLHPGAEASFVKAWSRVSELYLSDRGSLGSRLHRGPEGIWYSYAQWPSAEARERAFSMEPLDTEAERQMQEAIAEHLPSIVLESVADFMVAPLHGET